MKTEICSNGDGSYDLLAGGKIQMESVALGVAASVAYFLDNPKAWDTSEACEVAEAIRNSDVESFAENQEIS